MKRCMRIAWFTLILLLAMVATALANYPGTLDSGNLVLVDGGMGVGYYADRSSVQVEQYAPPRYQLSINVVGVTFSDEYWRSHETYIGGPYTMGDIITLKFRYNWDRKVISYQRGETWLDWDVNRDYCHAEGDPMIPYAAEVAFVSAYNMRFFDDQLGYSPVLKKPQRVIDEQLYLRLGI
ncbi:MULTISPECIES: hypothetical protein [unclassified Selenomonas]|uniref:hypothetical protein n=1 Tax=unclassified Selenomonas TaxID=2637378 RepID=UPI000496DF95|nr:hypothetical protein SAMN05216583_1639 [Selenomonas ruminantium]